MITAGVTLHQYDAVTKRVIELTLDNLLDDTKFVVKEIAPQQKIPEATKAPELPKVNLKVSSKEHNNVTVMSETPVPVAEVEAVVEADAVETPSVDIVPSTDVVPNTEEIKPSEEKAPTYNKGASYKKEKKD